MRQFSYCVEKRNVSGAIVADLLDAFFRILGVIIALFGSNYWFRQFLTGLLATGLHTATYANGSFQRITPYSGFPGYHINCIVKDSLGFIWIGGDDVLSRHDGLRFKEYHTEEQTEIVKTTSLLVDNDQQLWATINGKIHRYDYRKDQFLKSDYLDTVKNVSHLLMDTHETIWAITDHAIYYLPKDARDFYRFEVQDPEHKLAKYKFYDLETVNYSGKYLAIKTFNQISVLDLENGELVFYGGDDFDQFGNISAVWITEEGKLWLTAADMGLVLFDVFKGRIIKQIAPESQGLEYGSRIIQDVTGQIWFGTTLGLTSYHTVANQNQQYLMPVGPNRSSDEFVFDPLMVDHLGNFWVTYQDSELYYCTPSYNSIVRSLEDDLEQSLFDESNDICLASSKGKVWIGTWYGIDILDTKTFGRTHLLDGEFVHQIVPKNDSSVFVLSESDTTKHNPRVLLRLLINGEEEFVTEIFYTYREPFIFLDSKNKLWIVGEHLFNLDENNLYDSLQISTTEESLVLNMAEDNNGILFLIYGDRVVTYHPEQNTQKSTSYEALGVDNVMDFFIDSRNNAWIGTLEGLYKYAIDSAGSLHLKVEYGDENGFHNPDVRSIIEDENGIFWMASHPSVVSLNPDTHQFLRFPAIDITSPLETGTFVDEIRGSVSIVDDQGRVYFGSGNGIKWFNSKELGKEYDYPPLYITYYNTFDSQTEEGDGLKSAIFRDKLEFYSGNIGLNIHFSLLDYRDQANVEYLYRLKSSNFSGRWRRVDKYYKSVNYTYLAPGNYEFQLKARDAYGNWLPTVETIKLDILPHFWETNWFKTLLALAAIALIYLFYRLRSIQIRQRNVWLQREVSIRTRDLIAKNDQIEKLHGQLKETSQAKLQFFTNISHEVKTPLTLILGPLENLFNHYQDEYGRRQLRMIRSNTRRLHQLIDQLMEFRKVESNSLKLRVGEGDIISTLDEIFQSFYSLAIEKQIDYQFVNECKHTRGYFDKECLTKILFNLLSNAFKFTPERGRIKLIISEVTRGADQERIFQISVEDNGQGIPKEDVDSIFERFYQAESVGFTGGMGIGLALSKKLATVHHGDLKIAGTNGGGSTFILSIPADKSSYNRAEYSVSGISSVNSTLNYLKKLLPADNQIAKGSDLEEAEDDLVSVEKPTILVVDDEPEMRAFIADELSDDFKILTASNGKEGMEVAVMSNPSLVISDLVMPVADGISLCRQIKTNIIISHTPIILLTAKADDETHILGLGVGADKFVTKPFNARILRAQVTNLIDERRRLMSVFSRSVSSGIDQLPVGSKDQELLDAVVNYVNEHISNASIKIEDLTHEFGLNRIQLTDKLKKLAGQTPKEFVNNVRLDYAANLLRSPEVLVKEVAYMTGFANPKYFRLCFSKRFGATPTEFREKFLKGQLQS